MVSPAHTPGSVSPLEEEGGDSPPLLRSHETPPGKLHPDLGLPPEQGHGPAEVRPEEGHKNDQRI